jgi:hypothetical protein
VDGGHGGVPMNLNDFVAFVLRKLHVVRPDLIFYPLDWAVYC